MVEIQIYEKGTQTGYIDCITGDSTYEGDDGFLKRMIPYFSSGLKSRVATRFVDEEGAEDLASGTIRTRGDPLADAVVNMLEKEGYEYQIVQTKDDPEGDETIGSVLVQPNGKIIRSTDSKDIEEESETEPESGTESGSSSELTGRRRDLEPSDFGL